MLYVVNWVYSAAILNTLYSWFPSISTAAKPSLLMPTFSNSIPHSMQSIAENGIGAILVFEYLYFLLQEKAGGNDLQEDLNFIVEKYQSSGIQAKVNKLIQEAFKVHGNNVEILCPILVDIALQNQLSKMLNRKG
ncbi:hypothetical protein EDD16DRAFT_346556 [Pisolithus croceorrhizus]|nr:hypothetical protein EDD16DRAFT_346556 [Pisolithus croceorrhizus]